MSKRLPFIIDIVDTYKAGDPEPEGYREWHEWAKVQHKAGLRQAKCSRCGLWEFPQSMDSHACKGKAQERR